jgi:hypothetical protein
VSSKVREAGHHHASGEMVGRQSPSRGINAWPRMTSPAGRAWAAHRLTTDAGTLTGDGLSRG